jgi:hypothetical protein
VYCTREIEKIEKENKKEECGRHMREEKRGILRVKR